MKKYFVLFFILMFLVGCASKMENTISVTEYGASGKYVPFINTEVGGCVAQSKGNIDKLTLEYDGEKCKATYKKEVESKTIADKL